MSAPSKILNARPLLPIADLLKILAESGAASWELYPLEVPDVVDPLWDFAMSTWLVDAIGPDACQRIIAEPFANLRKELER
jgi:hypothetical protein